MIQTETRDPAWRPTGLTRSGLFVRSFDALSANLSISTKLFFMIVLTSLVVAIGSALASSVSFNNGFIAYVSRQSHEQMNGLAPTLAAGYKEHHGWQYILDDESRFFTLIQGFQTPAGPVKPHPHRPSTVVLVGLGYRLALLDGQGQRLAGNPEMENLSYRVPIVADGQTVGWLAEVPFATISGEAYDEFEQRRNRTVWIVAAICVLLAAMVAFPLSRWLTTPLRRIALATHHLAAGNFGERLQLAPRDEIGRLAMDFDALAQTLDRNEQLRRSYIADVSHELRTPLSVLRGELEAIEDGVLLPDKGTIQSLEAEVAIMSKLVTDLYDLALSDVGRLTYRRVPVDLGRVISVTLDAFGERLAQRQLALRRELAPPGPLIEADEARIRQLLHNLLENSCRYTAANGMVRVRLAYTAAEAQLDVDDTAPAVPHEHMDKLFDRFFRADASRSRATGGAGLGLAICREIVTAHGGRIEARHSLLGGLCIGVALPLHPPAGA